MDKIELGKPRGVRFLTGQQARQQREAEAAFRSCLHRAGL